jgi:uncharacterized protein YgiM (DUF1202 family)
MATSNKTTYYDRQKKWLKNTPILAWTFIILTAGGLLTAASGGFSFISQWLSPKTEKANKDKIADSDAINAVQSMRPSVENAAVNDPDGYLNIRSRSGKDAEIIGEINNGESIDIYTSYGDWLLIKTKSELIGYVYKNRIKL